MKDIFLAVCYNALKFQNKDSGEMPAGHNGPYYKPDTPIRNTSHWAVSFAKAYNLTQDDNFKIASQKCFDYLVAPSQYRTNFTFMHHFSEKDKENGTIGTAWTIESLIVGFQMFKKQEYINLALELYKSFKFNANVALWYQTAPNGTIREVDKTFNHQLWFAMSALMLYKETKLEEIKKTVDVFFQKLEKNFAIRSNGRIQHGIFVYTNLKSFIRANGAIVLKKYRKIFHGLDSTYKENGYHAFNIYAFAVIKSLNYYSDFFTTPKFTKALEFCFSKDFMQSLEDKQHWLDNTKLEIKNNFPFNRYGYSYNAPGFAMPFIFQVFDNFVNKQTTVDLFWENQIKYTYSSENKDFSQNTDDSATLTARIYELSRALY